MENEQACDDAPRSVTSYSGLPFSGPLMIDHGPLRTEPGVVDHREFLVNLVQRALNEGLGPTVQLADDWRFHEIASEASGYPGHEFKGPRKVIERLFYVLCDLERALFLFHPRLPADAIADFWWSAHVREYVDTCCETLEHTKTLEHAPGTLPWPHTVYIQAREQMRRLLVYHAGLVQRYAESASGFPDKVFDPTHWTARIEAWSQATYGPPKTNPNAPAEPNPNESGGKDAGPAVNAADTAGTDRRAAVDAFLLKCKQVTTLNAIRSHIWRLAGHETARQFQFWQACDPKATAQDDRNFGRILSMNPADFESLLRKKRII